jgi:DNA-binding transcriptional ArsR family regulator
MKGVCMKKIVSLSTKEELGIFMSPQRHQLLRAMRLYGRPMTAKMLSDKLGISASSASHHISKLMKLGIVEEDHTEIVNGIVARFFRTADVTVNIGQQLDDGLAGERTAIAQNILLNTLRGMNETIERAKAAGIPAQRLREYGDFLSGVVHLSPEGSASLLAMIRDFIDTHENASQHTQPWEYALILYNSGDKP